ncbi:MAG: type transport system permease protein, partial [Solirubrobacteraceae bacterium]|nr:type transport system permease protein [Solirubrobacteraceae bacterium]
MTVLARFALQEAIRRRVFTVVALLTAAFLLLYGLGVWQAFKIANNLGSGFAGVDPVIVTGATMFGLAMFGTLFLGVVLAVFLTLGAIRGDADRGLLQPLLVRPVSRRTLLTARLVSSGGVAGAYVVAVYVAAMLETGIIGGWWPDRLVSPAIGLALGVVIVCALSLAGSVVLASTANGIAIFMAFGAGLTAGLLGQIGRALNSGTLTDVADLTSYLLPFEALYQGALSSLTADTVGFTRFALQLGPLGGAHEAGVGLWLWALAYLALVAA